MFVHRRMDTLCSRMFHTVLYSEASTYVILLLWRPEYWEWRDFRTAFWPWWSSQRFSLIVLMPDLKDKSLWRKAYSSHCNTEGLSYTNEDYWHSNSPIDGIKQHFHYHSNPFCLDTLTWHIGSYQVSISFIRLFQLLYILLLSCIGDKDERRQKVKTLS